MLAAVLHGGAYSIDWMNGYFEKMGNNALANQTEVGLAFGVRAKRPNPTESLSSASSPAHLSPIYSLAQRYIQLGAKNHRTVMAAQATQSPNDGVSLGAVAGAALVLDKR